MKEYFDNFHAMNTNELEARNCGCKKNGCRPDNTSPSNYYNGYKETQAAPVATPTANTTTMPGTLPRPEWIPNIDPDFSVMPSGSTMPDMTESCGPMPTPQTMAVPVTTESAVADCNNCIVEKVGLAQAYVPFQMDFDLMEENRSLACGTAFPELVSPYRKNMDNLSIFESCGRK